MTTAALLLALPLLALWLTASVKFGVVLSVIQRGLGASAIPPAPLVLALSLIFSFAAIAPVVEQSWTASGAVQTAPVRAFLMSHTPERERSSFAEAQRKLRSADPKAAQVAPDDWSVLLPAFAAGELRSAFLTAFFIFLPFLLIELLVATVLTAMGLHTIRPETVALPLKLLLFVAIDGWHLLLSGLLVRP